MFKVSEISSVSATLARPQGNVLVFIDGGVSSPQFLDQGIIDGATAFILDSAQDGIKQITEILQNYHQVESIHLVSHGSPGSIQLGNTYLSLDTIAEYQQDLARWNSSSLLIYGCNVAAGDAGAELLDKLHQLTGSNIAASSNKIGQDGWQLESEVGQISVELAFNNQTQNQYLGSFGLTWDADNTLANNSPNITGQQGLEINGNFLYATDSYGHNIDIYQINNTTGKLTYKSSFGSQGSGADQFNYLVDLDFFTTAGGQTKAFVPDYGNKRIVVLDVNSTSGALTWDAANTLPVNSPNISGQYGLEVNGNFLYVTDHIGHNIDIYQIDGATGGLTYKSSFGSNGSGADQINYPIDLDFFTTAGGQTKAFVPDWGNKRIVVLDVNSTTGELTWDAANTLPNNSPNISGQYGLEVNGNSLYVTDSAGNNIDIYQINNTTGKLIYKSSFGSIGSGVNQFDYPIDLGFFTTTGGQTKAFVPDWGNKRIVALNVSSDGVERVSVSSDGTEGNYNSISPSISGDGRYVTFESNAGNLVTGDTNNTADIFVYDRDTNTTERVSVSSGSVGTQGNYPSYSPSISEDGRYVTFYSNASNLVDGDTNGISDVFVYDRDTNTTERISVSSGSVGTQGNRGSSSPSISGDGRYVTFYSNASNLVDGDTNGISDVFVYDRDTNTTERVSVSSGSVGTQGNYGSYEPSISGDGRYVTFQSYASNLVGGDTNDNYDIFVYDRDTNTTERVSVSSGSVGTQGNSSSYEPSISEDGRYVTFYSFASNLVGGDTNDRSDVFVYDRDTGTTERVSIKTDGTQGNSNSETPSISEDGRYVTFQSYASNLVDGDTNDNYDIFVYDRDTNTTERVSIKTDGTQGNKNSVVPSISGDGRYVTFYSGASNLVDGDTNNAFDIFVVENPPLVAKADSNTTNKDSSLTVAAPGVLSNDSGDNIIVTAADTTSARGAAVVVNPNGSYSYNPTAVAAIQALGAGEDLSDTFNYAISNSSGATASAKVTINLTGVNNTPQLNQEIANVIARDNAPFSLDVSSNFSDPDTNDQLNFSATGLPQGLSISQQGVISGEPVNGAYDVTITAEDLTASVTDKFKLTVYQPIQGTANSESLIGNEKLNEMIGLAGNDTITGLAGSDRLFGGNNNDVLNGGNQNDLVGGGSGHDQLFGGYGDDILGGGNHNDSLSGGFGNDSLGGGSGDDQLVGGAGTDLLTGGANADVFILQSNLGLDTITDFSLNEDQLQLAAGFQGSLGLTQSAGSTTISIVGEGGTAIALLQGVTDVTLEDLGLVNA